MAKKTKIKQSQVAVFGVLLLLIALVFFRGSVADFFWKKLSVSTPAVLWSSDPQIVFAVGEYNFGGGAYNMSLAERAYKKTLSLDSSYPWANYQLGRIYLVKNKMLTAKSFLDKELEIYPDHDRVYYVRGIVNGFAKDLSTAEKDFETFINAHPSEWAGYNDLAWILLKGKKWQEAKNVIKRGLDATGDNQNPWLWNGLGVAELNLSDYKNAKVSFETALVFAQELTESDWVRAYPGNDPKEASTGLLAFKEALKKNIELASSKL